MISYQKSNYFSTIINDYLDEKPSLQSLYNRFPKIENFEAQIVEKNLNFKINGIEKRKVLVSVLKEQYRSINVTTATHQNIDNLLDENCFTITTGHQLNLFTGPIYFLYKIISTINLCKDLKIKYPLQNFTPIYWMATEDHDFEEVNFFNFKDKKLKWQTAQTGAVGRFSLDGLALVFEEFATKIGTSQTATELKDLFEKAYLNHHNLADATRFLVNELFGTYGLVILDADNHQLKQQFIPFIKDELLNQNSYKKVTATNLLLSDYKIQVTPREINLFYLTKNGRERIVFENDIYKINNTKIEFSETEILNQLTKMPENFSPNVILRPLYQEVVLPNLCYIGGGGELAYWLQLKAMFEHHRVTFPMLLLRNSVIISTIKQQQKLEKLNLSWQDLFLKQQALINQQTQKLSNFPIDFSQQKKHLLQQFKNLYEIANQTDKSFFGTVKAQEKKQLNGLDNLEKRLLKAQKRKYFEILQQTINLQDELFPNKSLQERQLNFSQLYLENGTNFIHQLFENLKPLEQKFSILSL